MARILEVENLVKSFSLSGGMRVHAVEDVTFNVDRAETLALVGESGCGKTTVANLAMRLQKPDSGTIRLLDTDITELGTRELRDHRRHLQMIFQDPFASLNPRKIVGKIVGDPMRLNRTASNSDIDSRVAELFELVGLSADDMKKYPHQFSGGQRQRICIARASLSIPASSSPMNRHRPWTSPSVRRCSI